LYHAGSWKLEAGSWTLYPSRVPLTAQSRITLSKNQASCDLAGEMAIVNFDNGVYYGLDPTGARIWNLLRQPSTIEQLCDTLADVYHVDRPTLESDVRAFVHDLAEHGLVEIE
jgi:coenzyme PQQ synthesis protein D (PqqD)